MGVPDHAGRARRAVLILSMWQPWATLVVARDAEGRIAKWNETRGFPIRAALAREFPLEVAIHAAANSSCMRALENRESRWGLEYGALFRNLLTARGYTTRNVPLGAIVGVVKIVGQRSTDNLAAMPSVRLTDEERALGNYHPGRWAWFFAEQKALQVSIQFRGRQNVLWPAPPELEAEIRSRL